MTLPTVSLAPYSGRRSGAKCCLVKQIINSFGGFAAIVQIANISYLKGKFFGIFFQKGKQIFNLTGCEAVEYPHCMSLYQQGFREIGANETGPAGYQYFIHIYS